MGPKSLRGNMSYKGHKDIAEAASHLLKKAFILLKNSYKSLHLFKIFLKSPHHFYKSPTLSLKMSIASKFFKMPHST
jgi:hypothetical protein